MIAATFGALTYYLGAIEMILLCAVLLVFSAIDRLVIISGHRASDKLLSSGDDDKIQKYYATLDRQIARLEQTSKVLGTVQLFIFAVGVALITIISTPWLPAVSLTVGDGQPFTAYILSSGNELVVLTDDSRQVEYINSNDVTHKFVCTTGSDWLNEPIPLLLSNHTRYPQCPK